MLQMGRQIGAMLESILVYMWRDWTDLENRVPLLAI